MGFISKCILFRSLNINEKPCCCLLLLMHLCLRWSVCALTISYQLRWLVCLGSTRVLGVLYGSFSIWFPPPFSFHPNPFLGLDGYEKLFCIQCCFSVEKDVVFRSTGFLGRVGVKKNVGFCIIFSFWQMLVLFLRFTLLGIHCIGWNFVVRLFGRISSLFHAWCSSMTP